MEKESTRTLAVERQEDFLSLRSILTVVFKHKLLIMSVFLSMTLSSLILPLFMTPMYQAETSLLVKIGREHMFTSEAHDTDPQMTVDLKTLVDPELSILTSRDLIRRVIKTLGLHVAYPDLIDNPSEKMSPLEIAVLQFQKKLDVRQQGESNIINVTFEHKNPMVTARAVNLLAKLWKKHRLEVFSSPQTPFLEEQTDTYRDRLEQSETQLQQFKREHGISSFEEQKRLLLDQRQQLDAKIKTTQNDMQGLATKIESLTNQMKVIPRDIPLSTVNEERRMIDETKRELLALQRNEQVLSGRYHDTNRKLVDLRNEIELIRAFIDEQEDQLEDTVTTGRNPVYEQLELVLLRTKSERAALNTQHRVLTNHFQDLENQIGNLSRLQKEFDEIRREVTNDQENLIRYREKVEVARISQEMDRQQIANVSVIQAAAVPVEPVTPKKFLIAFLGMILGAVSGLAMAFIPENQLSSYTRPEQASNDLGLPILVSITKQRITE